MQTRLVAGFTEGILAQLVIAVEAVALELVQLHKLRHGKQQWRDLTLPNVQADLQAMVAHQG